MEKILFNQYELLKESRATLHDFCSTLKNEHFVNEFENFGRGSIRNLLVHVLNTYEYWLRNYIEESDHPYVTYDEVTDVHILKEKYKIADFLVVEFLISFREKMEEPLEGKTDGRGIAVTPLRLFTHVITHEYHHKGQVLSMSRHLGYTPVDTDILR